VNALLLLLLLSAYPAEEVRGVLRAQAAAWNRGDLPGFLGSYRHSPELTFFSNGAVIRGFDAVRQRYEKRYGVSAASMGKLEFQDLEITVLAPDAAFACGRYRLQDSSGTVHTGLFSLLLRKSSRWEVVHDHTSTGP
jgi:ketosteroid isomerase-like protein